MPRKLRLVIAIGSMTGGGSERQVLTLLKHLDRSRFDPVLYLIFRRGELLDELPPDVPAIAFADSFSPPRWNLPGRVHLAQIRHLTQTIRQHKADVLYDRTLVMTLVAGPAARRARVPHVTTVVADPVLDLRQAGRFQPVKRWLLRRAYRRADRVVAVSSELRSRVVQAYGLAPDRVCVIQNPIDLERVDRLAAEPVERFAEDRFHVVSAGRLQQQKGYPFLLDAMDRLVNERNRKQLVLHILGQGPQEPMLRALAASKNLTSHVVFHGFVPNPYPYYRAAHLVCLASLYEGMPNVLLEAMACRTPVVATDCPTGPREVLDGGRFGRLVPPADAAALADAIDEVIQHHEQSAARAEQARSWVQRRFSVAASIGALEELFLELAGRRAARTRGAESQPEV